MIIKKLSLRFCCYVLFFTVFSFIFMVDAMETNMNLYNPKDIMENANTIIEGGRYSYDSFKIQDH